MAKKFRHHRFLVLFVALLTLCMTQPLAGRFVGGTYAFDGLAAVVTFTIVLTVFNRHRERVAALLLATPAAITRLSTYLLPGSDVQTMSITHNLITIVVLGFAICTILRGIFEETTISHDHLLGTICGYLMAGLAWGNAYQALDAYSADSFLIAPQIVAQIHNEHYRALYFNYFSLCTLTNASFGDITPTASFATTLTWIEAAFGQFYIAVVVAQLVGLRLAQALHRQAGRQSHRIH